MKCNIPTPASFRGMHFSARNPAVRPNPHPTGPMNRGGGLGLAAVLQLSEWGYGTGSTKRCQIADSPESPVVRYNSLL